MPMSPAPFGCNTYYTQMAHRPLSSARMEIQAFFTAGCGRFRLHFRSPFLRPPRRGQCEPSNRRPRHTARAHACSPNPMPAPPLPFGCNTYYIQMARRSSSSVRMGIHALVHRGRHEIPLPFPSGLPEGPPDAASAYPTTAPLLRDSNPQPVLPCSRRPCRLSVIPITRKWHTALRLLRRWTLNPSSACSPAILSSRDKTSHNCLAIWMLYLLHSNG